MLAEAPLIIQLKQNSGLHHTIHLIPK
jgi:hypothetical protein